MIERQDRPFLRDNVDWECTETAKKNIGFVKKHTENMSKCSRAGAPSALRLYRSPLFVPVSKPANDSVSKPAMGAWS